jgi:hypothetical protein
MTKPRGRRGSSDGAKTLIVTVRLDSRPLARKLHQCSRGRGVSINTFCNAAITAAVENPDPIVAAIDYEPSAKPEPPVEAAQAVTELATSKSSDAFDFISLSKLGAIAKSCSVTESQAHQLIGLFIDAVR